MVNIPISFDSKLHKRDGFDCGEIDLNLYIQNIAPQDQKRKTCSIYVLLNKDNVIGYYTISPFTLQFSELPLPISKKYPSNKLLPCYLIGKLAVDLSNQKKGLGKILLMDALKKIKQAAMLTSGYCVVVDTKTEKSKTFYQKYGFEILDETQNTRRFILPIADIP